MSYVCEITGKRRLKGNRVSHANNRTNHFQQPNLQERTLFVPELNQSIKVRLCTGALRTIDKHGGLARCLLKLNPDKFSLKLLRLKKMILKKGKIGVC
jgi:large subunit ribosomal protein L28